MIMVPVIIIFAYMPSVMYITRSIVAEKEAQLKVRRLSGWLNEVELEYVPGF